MSLAYVNIGGKPLSQEEGKVIALEACRAIREKQEESRLSRRAARLPDAPERRSVAEAMLAVEIRLVKAFWTIARQPFGKGAPLLAARCGLEYFHDRDDTHARYADAPGGKWEALAPRPSLPSSKEIDDANQALDWLLLIDDELLRKLLVVGATNKRGDAGRNISWTRVRQAMPELGRYTTRRIKQKYREALRIVVDALTIARFAA
jgi:hypothetical protein